MLVSVAVNPHWGIRRTGVVYHVWPEGPGYKQAPGACEGVVHPGWTLKAGVVTPQISP